jgi:hypothetical protein
MTEPPAYVCSHVFNDSRPVLLVSRAGGDWQLLCGQEHDSDEVPQVVGLNHLVERDPSLADVRDLPDDWEAERSDPASPWRRMPPGQVPVLR